MAASAENQKRVQSQVAVVMPDGGTDHMTALRAALALKSEVIYFLTDADLLIDGDVNEILEEMGQAPKQVPGPVAASRASSTAFVALASLGRHASRSSGSTAAPKRTSKAPCAGWPRPPEDLTSISM